MPAPVCPTIRFGSHEISYDDRVLEPRPWTRLHSDWATELCAEVADGAVLELCAGVGHIGLAGVARTQRRLVQVDANPVACEFARHNASAAGVEDRVEVRCGDLADVVGDESFALVLADPPYLPSDLVDRHPDDPVGAIDGGPDGLDVLRACLSVIDRVLAPGGAALVQVFGEAQARALGLELPPDLVLAGTRAHDDERAVALLVRATATVHPTPQEPVNR